MTPREAKQLTADAVRDTKLLVYEEIRAAAMKGMLSTHSEVLDKTKDFFAASIIHELIFEGYSVVPAYGNVSPKIRWSDQWL